MHAPPALRFLPLVIAALGFVACSLDPQPEPPMTPSGAIGGQAGSAGSMNTQPDAGQSDVTISADANLNDAAADSPVCPGCSEGKCEAGGGCPCDAPDGGCEADSCACPDSDACIDAPDSEADATDDASVD